MNDPFYRGSFTKDHLPKTRARETVRREQGVVNASFPWGRVDMRHFDTPYLTLHMYHKVNSRCLEERPI